MNYTCNEIEQFFDKLFDRKNSLEDIEKYIKYNKRFLNEIYINNTPLTLACKREKYDIAKLLLSYGADPNMQDDDDYTPLIEACKNYNVDMIKLLLEYDADPNIKNNSGKTPLDIAKTKEIKSLLQRKI